MGSVREEDFASRLYVSPEIAAMAPLPGPMLRSQSQSLLQSDSLRVSPPATRSRQPSGDGLEPQGRAVDITIRGLRPWRCPYCYRENKAGLRRCQGCAKQRPSSKAQKKARFSGTESTSLKLNDRGEAADSQHIAEIVELLSHVLKVKQIMQVAEMDKEAREKQEILAIRIGLELEFYSQFSGILTKAPSFGGVNEKSREEIKAICLTAARREGSLPGEKLEEILRSYVREIALGKLRKKQLAAKVKR